MARPRKTCRHKVWANMGKRYRLELLGILEQNYECYVQNIKLGFVQGFVSFYILIINLSV